MMLFSTGTRLECVRNAGSELELALVLALDFSTKTRKKEGRQGLRTWPLQCLSHFLHAKRIDQLLRGRVFCVPFTGGVA